MAKARLYLDHNAGSPLRVEARAAMLAVFERAGNPSSVHAEGRAARASVEAARRQVAALVGAVADRVVFTGGGTEANVTVLSPRLRIGAGEVVVDTLIVGATEHPSVLAGGRFPAERVRRLPVDGDGIARLDALGALLSEERTAGRRALVSVMLANNETGVVQPVAAVAAVARGHGALVHSDAVQAAGRIPVDIAALGVDFLTLSAHKIGGPQGVGAIVLGGDLAAPAPLVTGGGQEKGARAGTQNVAGIAGFGAAAEAARSEVEAGADAARRDRLAAALGGAVLVGAAAERLPQTLCVAVPGVPAETLVIALDLEGAAVSSGAACSSGKVGPSHVLAAMGLSDEIARSAVRISFGWSTADEELERFTDAWRRVMERLAPAVTRAA
ncbi:cysteine desulfurase family protein [Prosthecomicrobium pneumaticum]|uniref:Cysteine desulfurase n=1 Tax=Prosthecomicrobium pneumaticum TaxID=81895 RepID=A0A7W9FPT7_9HYPH|nr:cysteine desulfurase family protein [Prosthecomicrobium pneumaticum]MBB5754648.1 cysteine desulfurase [Prosthecomicrobium pneumaticum]